MKQQSEKKHSASVRRPTEDTPLRKASGKQGGARPDVDQLKPRPTEENAESQRSPKQENL